MNTNKIEIKYGLLMLIGFIAYFFAMKGFDLYENTYLRIFNGFIHIGFIVAALREIRNFDNSGENYLKTFLVGVRTGLYGVIPFALFQFIYLEFIDPEFMQAIIESANLGSFLTPFSSSLLILVEGIAATIFSSWITMRVFGIREGLRPGNM